MTSPDALRREWSAGVRKDESSVDESLVMKPPIGSAVRKIYSGTLFNALISSRSLL